MLFLKSAFLFLFLFSAPFSYSFQNAIEIAKSRCFAPQKNEPYLTSKDFPKPWLKEWLDIRKLAHKLYRQPQRLLNRAYYNPYKQAFILPLSPLFNEEEPQEIQISGNFILSIISHVETALEHQYAEEIIFSDMGHSHLLIPENYYETQIQPIESLKDQYEAILNFDETKFLYHTAEQLSMIHKTEEEILLPEDPHLKHRYLTRNIVGDNKQSKSLELVQVENLNKEYNTVRKYEGYLWWAPGYYIQANRQACFPFKKDGKVYYFDIGLSHFPYGSDDDAHIIT